MFLISNARTGPVWMGKVNIRQDLPYHECRSNFTLVMIFFGIYRKKSDAQSILAQSKIKGLSN
jgi:hypothetical protein